MVEHARDVAKLNERCNVLGLDTMSTGNLVGEPSRPGSWVCSMTPRLGRCRRRSPGFSAR